MFRLRFQFKGKQSHFKFPCETNVYSVLRGLYINITILKTVKSVISWNTEHISPSFQNHKKAPYKCNKHEWLFGLNCIICIIICIITEFNLLSLVITSAKQSRNRNQKDLMHGWFPLICFVLAFKGMTNTSLQFHFTNLFIYFFIYFNMNNDNNKVMCTTHM